MSLTIPLAPHANGRSISSGALETADILVSTTRAAVSGVIRTGTLSYVSHASIYVGGGLVIEAIGQGVVRQALPTALADDVLAVAYRHPRMTPTIAANIVNYAVNQLGKSYSTAKAAASLTVACLITGRYSSSFFCSEFVAEAFRQGGLPLIDVPSACVSPHQIVTIAESRLSYVGHLLGRESRFPMIAP